MLQGYGSVGAFASFVNPSVPSLSASQKPASATCYNASVLRIDFLQFRWNSQLRPKLRAVNIDVIVATSLQQLPPPIRLTERKALLKSLGSDFALVFQDQRAID